MRSSTKTGRSSKALVLAGLATVLVAGPALAEGRWIRGGGLDGLTPVAFGRYLAEADEAQMTVRCDDVTGLSIDAGTTANGTPPADTDMEGFASASFTFVNGASRETVATKGEVRIRGGLVVLVALTGAEAAKVGDLLREPAERLEITIDGQTKGLTLLSAPPFGTAADLFNQIAASCSGWPVAQTTPMQSATAP
jgi:hypothetical protein